MHVQLIQLLLPVTDNEGRPHAAALLEDIKHTLVEKFGGLTAYNRAPAQGVWAPRSGEKVHDDVVVLEVMAGSIDEAWWRQFRQSLETALKQQEIVIRSFVVRRI